MLNSILSGNSVTAVVTPGELAACTAVSLLLGLMIASAYMYHSHYSKSFVATLVLLPVMVQAVIMLVNGNLGAGVAVAGAFSLVRFRSQPGTAKEIGSIFLTMTVGLATGMGYLGIAVLLCLVVCLAMIVLYSTSFGEKDRQKKALKITIPENLDYTGLFDDLFDEYTVNRELIRVKTTNMGSLYELFYLVTLKDSQKEKAFLDELRCRNGNLTISLGRVDQDKEEL